MHDNQTPPPDSGRLTMPRLTTPTWEVEMLLSGAVVFALFQVPEPINRWSDLASARSGQAGDMLASLASIYALMVIYALIAMFLVHLTARAYWIALVGVDSVFPGGVRWENYRQGPIARAQMQRLVPSMPTLVERADNFSSLCFSFGLLVVMSAMLGAAFALPAAAIAVLIDELAFDGTRLMPVMVTVMALTVGPLALAGAVDRIAVRRGWVSADGSIARAIAWIFRLPINALPAPLMLMLTTNLRRRRGSMLLIGAMLLLTAALLLNMFASSGKLRLDGYAYLPADAHGHAVDMRHYRDLRSVPPDDPVMRQPSIDSMTPEGRYLRLFVPYLPKLHGPMVKRRCVDAQGVTPDPQLLSGPVDARRLASEQSLLECLARELDLRALGEPIPPAWLAFSSDPASGLRGVQAMIPIDGLAPGRHEVSLQQPLRPRDLPTDATGVPAPPPRTKIAFWR